MKEGKGVVKNETAAAVWYSKAAAQGVVQAMFNLGTAFYKGHGVQQNETHGIEMIAMAASMGDPYSEDTLRKLSDAGDARAEKALEQVQRVKHVEL